MLRNILLGCALASAAWAVSARPSLALPAHVTARIAGDNVILDGSLNEHPSYSDIWGYTAPDGREFALLGTYTGTAVIDISDRHHPREVGFVPGPTSAWREIKTLGTWVYIVSEGGGGLQIANLADPAHPAIANPYMGFTRAHNLWVDPATNVVYVAGRDRTGGVLMLHLNTPSGISTLGAWDLTYAHDVFSRDNILYLSAIYQGRLYILDVTNPATPQTLGYVGNYPDAFTHNAWPTDDGHHVLTTDERSGAYLRSWDITDPTHPSLAGFYGPLDGARSIPHNVFVDGHLAYVSWYTMGVIVVDVSDPSDLHEVARYDTHPQDNAGIFEGCWGVFPFYPNSPGLFVASDIQTGLYVLELESGLAARVAADRRAAAPSPVAPASGRAAVPVAARSAGAALELGPALPNPAGAAGVTLALRVAAPTTVRAEVLDAAGRRVRALGQRTAPAGESSVVWDGRDGSGRRAAAGAYFVRVSAGATALVRKVLVVR